MPNAVPHLSACATVSATNWIALTLSNAQAELSAPTASAAVRALHKVRVLLPRIAGVENTAEKINAKQGAKWTQIAVAMGSVRKGNAWQIRLQFPVKMEKSAPQAPPAMNPRNSVRIFVSPRKIAPGEVLAPQTVSAMPSVLQHNSAQEKASIATRMDFVNKVHSA